MKKLIWAFLASVVLLNVSQAQSTCDKFVVTGPPTSPPASWIDKGELKGAAVELLATALKGADIKNIEFKPFTTWSDAVQSVFKGEVDMIMRLVWSAERARMLHYIKPPLLREYVEVVVRKGEKFSVLNLQDLAGSKRAATVKGQIYGQGLFGQFVENQLKPVRTDELEEAFDLLLKGDVDYVFNWESGIYYLMFQQNLGTKVEFLTTFPYQADFYYAFSKHSKCYRQYVTQITDALSKASVAKNYLELSNKYRRIFEESLIAR